MQNRMEHESKTRNTLQQEQKDAIICAMKNTARISPISNIAHAATKPEIASLFGLALVHAWIYAFNTSNEVACPWQYVYLAIAATMLALALISRKRAAFITSKPACAIAGIFGMAAPLLAFVAHGNPLGTLTLIFGGIFVGWAYSIWGIVYSKCTMPQAIFLLFVSGIIAAILKTVFFCMPGPIVQILLAILAPIALLTGASACILFQSNPRGALRFTKKDVKSLWKVAALVVVFSIVNANLLANEQIRPATMTMGAFLTARAAEIFLCACILAWTFLLKKPFNFVQLWRIILVLLATDIVVRIAFPGIAFQPLFSNVCVNFIVLFVWLTLSDIAQHSDIAPSVVFGIGWSLYTIPLFAGVTITQKLGTQTTEAFFLALLLYFMLIVSTFCLELRDRDIQLIFSDVNADAAPMPQEFADIDTRCANLAEKKHLTARELEVMQMLCKGRTKAYIAESMFVTENTVKGHTKRLYAKLGVHSKKELQQLIDVE